MKIRKIGLAGFAILFLISCAFAQETKVLEDFIFNNSDIIRNNSNIKKITFHSKIEKTVKLITFSDENMEIRFLLGSLNLVLPPDLESGMGVMPDVIAIPIKIDDSEFPIIFGKFGNAENLEDSYKNFDANFQKEFNISPDECSGIDEKKRKEGWNKLQETGVLPSVEGFFTERPEKCLRAALIDNIIEGNFWPQTVFGPNELLQRMAKMDFKIEKVVIEDNYFVVEEKSRHDGFNADGVHVFVLNGKPVGLYVFGVTIN